MMLNGSDVMRLEFTSAFDMLDFVQVVSDHVGRRESEASPSSRLVNDWPANTPASILIVVPELPASSGPPGGVRCPSPRPVTMRTSAESSAISVPRARRQASVDRQSAPGA